MSAITQPSSNGITAQAMKASITLTSGARKNSTLLAPAGMITSLKQEFERVGDGLQQAEGAHHIGAAPHLHRRPDLAVGQDDRGDRQHQHQADHQDEDRPG